MKETIFSSGLIFYAADNNNRFTITMKIGTIDYVDESCLKTAISKTSQRYQFLKFKVEKNYSGLWLEENNLPWALNYGEKSPPIGSPEANYHLITFTWEEKTILIHTFHGFLDGIGLNKIAKTLMFYYSESRYSIKLDSKGINVLEDEVSEEEYRDPFPRKKPANKLQPMAKTPRFTKALKIFNKRKNTGEQYIYRFTIPKSSLVNVMNELEVSPAPFLGITMAKAIQNIHQNNKHEVCIGIPINLRPALDADKYLRNLVYDLHVMYDEKIMSMPINLQCTAVRGRVFLQSDKDSVLNECEFQRKVFNIIKHIPFYGIKRLLSKSSIKFNMNDETFSSSYTGKATFGEMEKYFDSMEVLCDTCGEDMLIEMFLMRDTFTITIMQRFKDDRYTDEFIRLFKEFGVTIENYSCEKLLIPEIGF